MTKKQPARYSLLLSVLALLLGLSTFVGSTFAWFTGSTTSADNKIVSGTLKVELWMNTDGTEYRDISEESAPIFGASSIAQNENAETLWEPGKTQVAYLAIHNSGNLALRYVVNLKVENISRDLYKVMQYAVTTDAKYGEVTSWQGNGSYVAVGLQAVCDPVTLGVDETHYFALSVHMDDDASNVHQGGQVNFDLSVAATQASNESDSFSCAYDQDSTYEEHDAQDTFGQEPDPAPYLGTGIIAVTANNIDTVDFTQDGVTYALVGAFDTDVLLSAPSGLTQTYDASRATFASGVTVTVSAPDVAHNYDSLAAPRIGDVTVTGFHVDTLNVLAYAKESVAITNNTAHAVSVIGGNAAFDISGNTVDGEFKRYNDGEGQSNDFGISLRITDYELSVTSNVITNTYSHAIAINGRQGDWESCGADNQIVAFSGNNITVNSTDKTQRAALKIWCDQVYAPYATSGSKPNANAKALMQMIIEDTTNVFTLGEGHTVFNIYDYRQ